MIHGARIPDYQGGKVWSAWTTPVLLLFPVGFFSAWNQPWKRNNFESWKGEKNGRQITMILWEWYISFHSCTIKINRSCTQIYQSHGFNYGMIPKPESSGYFGNDSPTKLPKLEEFPLPGLVMNMEFALKNHHHHHWKNISVRFSCTPWLVGGWTNPFEKYARQNWIISPGIGMKIFKKIELPPPSLEIFTSRTPKNWIFWFKKNTTSDLQWLRWLWNASSRWLK